MTRSPDPSTIRPEVTAQVRVTRSNGDVEVHAVAAAPVLAPRTDESPVASRRRRLPRTAFLRRRAALARYLGPALVVQFALAVVAAAVLAAIVYTDAGQAHVVDVLDPATRGAQTSTYYGTWGSGSTAPAVGQTALVTELAEARVAATVSQPAANTIRWLWEVTATGNRTVNEFGVFTANAAGTMLIRGTLSTLNIETGDRVEFTVDLVQKDVSE